MAAAVPVVAVPAAAVLAVAVLAVDVPEVAAPAADQTETAHQMTIAVDVAFVTPPPPTNA